MQKVFQLKILFILLSFTFNLAFAENKKDEKNIINKDTTVNIHFQLDDFVSGDEGRNERGDSAFEIYNSVDNLVKFKTPWKIKIADDSIYSSEYYDDSNWAELTKEFSKKIRKDRGSVKWYRIHFEIDSSLMNVPLAFSIRQFGSAAEVYLDGKYLKSFGKIGRDEDHEIAELSINPKATAFLFEAKKVHLLAIRMSDFHRADPEVNKLNLHINFQISIKHLDKEIDSSSGSSAYFPFIFFSAVFLTLGFFHLIFFIFNHKNRSNLVYSLYCFGVFGFTYGVYHVLTTTEFESVMTTLLLLMYAVPFIFVMLVGMLHRIFYGKRLKIFWIFPVLLTVAIECLLTGKFEGGTIAVIILFFAGTVEILRVIIQAIRRKKDGAWIFAMVVLLAPIAAIISSNLPDTFHIAGLQIPNNTGAIAGTCFILGLPFAMTLYLARDFSRMAKRLKKQLNEITDLSEKTIQQEKEKKQILENQKAELEIKILERTKEVIEQKEVIEIKNREITDSLNYAKRIQSAILPDVKLIYQTLEQSFILYLPKDIVSGDFYAFAHKENKVLIAAADCTGHGVAGAFMSMIGSSLLNMIINEKNVLLPSDILQHLNEGIIDVLKQKENESNDGMDIALCVYDMDSKELQFAGANRPLWLIRNNELVQYKPDKFPIGGLQIKRDEKFSRHTITMHKDDLVYIFSDGYADQFGGSRGKKLMTKKFREMLLSIQHLSMQEQYQFTKDYFEKWKGRNEQLDDVLLIGIKF